MLLRVLTFLLFMMAVNFPASAVEEPWVELPEDQAIRDQTRAAFLAGEFDRLDAWADDYLTSRSRTASGNWKLLLFYSTFGYYPHFLYADYDDATLVRMTGQVQKWIDARPHSRAARIVMGMAIMDRAWLCRGRDALPRIPLECWATYVKYKKQSFDYLMSVRNGAADDPHWYAALLEAMLPEGPKLGDPEATAKEAAGRFGDYGGIYEPIVLIHAPLFGARQETLDDLIEKTADTVGGIEGDIVYARIYLIVAERITREYTFGQTRASWVRLDAGFKAVMERYPTQRYRNAHALFACLARDKRRIRDLTPPVIESGPLAEVWFDREDMAKYCLEYANQPG